MYGYMIRTQRSSWLIFLSERIRSGIHSQTLINQNQGVSSNKGCLLLHGDPWLLMTMWHKVADKGYFSPGPLWTSSSITSHWNSEIMFSRAPATATTRELLRVWYTNPFTMAAEFKRICSSSLWCHASISTSRSIIPTTPATLLWACSLH